MTEELFDLESAYLDIDAIEQGRWVPLGAEFPGVEVKARGLSSPGAKKLLSHLRRTAPKSDRMSNGMLTEEADQKLIRITVARECVMDWKGLASGGKALPFSAETLEGIMNEPRARPLAAAFVNAIVAVEKTKASAEKAVLGNSEAP